MQLRVTFQTDRFFCEAQTETEEVVEYRKLSVIDFKRRASLHCSPLTIFRVVDCKSVAKLRKHLAVCFKILFFFSGKCSRDNKSESARLFHSTDISQLVACECNVSNRMSLKFLFPWLWLNINRNVYEREKQVFIHQWGCLIVIVMWHLLFVVLKVQVFNAEQIHCYCVPRDHMSAQFKLGQLLQSLAETAVSQPR
jgi:hypothetical protein